MTSIMDRIVRKVGEGYDRPDGDSLVPIDINYARLAEWLVDRKQCPADWNRKLQAIQAKAAEALKDLPPGFLGQFEGGEEVPLDYLRAKEVLTKLSETAEKGFLGSFKGVAGDWEKIVRAYEYNLLFLGEAALTLGRNTDFEIPFLKKQAAKYQQQLADLERKQAEALKSAAAAAADFQQECKSLGIEGRDIRGGLLGLTSELPALVGAAVEALDGKAVGEAVDHYRAFAAHCGCEAGGAADLLPTLQEVREGRTEPPSAPASAPATAAAPSDSDAAPAGIDWRLDVGAASDTAAAGVAGGGISWDLDVSAGGEAGGEASEAPGGGISWDLGDLTAALEGAGEGPGADAGGDEAGAPLDISWDIDLTTAGEEAEELLAAQQAEQQPGDGPGGAAAGVGPGAAAAFADAPPAVQRLIEDHAYRGRLLDDLLELRAFLTQRCSELSSKGNELLASSLPEELQHMSSGAVRGMRDAVAAAIATLTGERLQQLVQLRTSPRHLDRLAQSLTQKGGQEAKFKRAAREAEAKRGEAQRQLMADSAKLAVLVKRTRLVKAEVERALGAKLARHVNILGEINNVI